MFNDYLQMKQLVDGNYIQLRRDRVSIATGSEQMVEALSDEEVEQVLAYVADESQVTVRNRLFNFKYVSYRTIKKRSSFSMVIFKI